MPSGGHRSSRTSHLDTRKGAGRWKHENDNKNSGKRLWVWTIGLGYKVKRNCMNTLRPRQNGRQFLIFSHAFSRIKMCEFRLCFHCSLLLRFQLTLSQHWFRLWLGAGQATSYYLNQWWLVYWRIYASPGSNELMRVACKETSPHNQRIGQRGWTLTKQACICDTEIW